MALTLEQIASIAHEANRQLTRIIGNPAVPVQVSWQDFPESEKAAIVRGVLVHLNRTTPLTPEQSHEAWRADKLSHGWKHGPVKDVERKEHPNLVPYKDLPEGERIKDTLFTSIVTNLLAMFPKRGGGTTPMEAAIENVLPGTHKRPDGTQCNYLALPGTVCNKCGNIEEDTGFLCPRRNEMSENEPSVFKLPSKDKWLTDGNGARSCSYCGGLHPDDFMERVRSGQAVEPTDKTYKAYLVQDLAKDRRWTWAKFYFMHLSAEQQHEFIDLLNKRKVNIGYPHHFYVLPYFISR